MAEFTEVSKTGELKDGAMKAVNVAGIDIRSAPQMRDQVPSPVTLEGAEPQMEVWPKVKKFTPAAERVVYPGAGSELFHGKKTP